MAKNADKVHISAEPEVESRWTEEGRAYAVVTGHDPTAKPARSGLSHVQAMTFAEEVRREGRVASVMHVVGDKMHEVDRYPCR